MVDMLTEDTVLRVCYFVHLPLTQRPALMRCEHGRPVFCLPPFGSHFQQVARAAEDIQRPCLVREEAPCEMGNDATGFLQGKARMQETRHLAQLGIDSSALLYFSPPAEQEA